MPEKHVPCDRVIGKQTGVSFGLLIIIVIAVAGAASMWWDIKGDLRSLREDVARMWFDRWTATDDEIYMKDYTNHNKLTMPQHERTVPSH